MTGYCQFSITHSESLRSSLPRFEAHFNFGFHFDAMAALDWGLVAKLRPRHSLTKLRAGFELRDFSFRVDDDLAPGSKFLMFPNVGKRTAKPSVFASPKKQAFD